MKDKIIIGVLGLLLVSAVCSVAYGAWFVDNKLRYEYYFENRVKETVHEVLKEYSNENSLRIPQ